MIVAVMQPYFFPYIGYFQLMHAVDAFVFFDDVQYIDRGWVNRNRIPIDGKPAWLTMPVHKASRSLPISQREYLLDHGAPAIKRKLQAAYRTTDGSELIDAINSLLDFPDANVARFNANTLMDIARQLGLGCRFLNASNIMAGEEGLHGESRVIDICKQLGASQYINPIGGSGLYDPSHFATAGIKLSFLRTTSAPSHTPNGPTHFSIIDVLMRHGFQAAHGVLTRYELLDGTAK